MDNDIHWITNPDIPNDVDIFLSLDLDFFNPDNIYRLDMGNWIDYANKAIDLQKPLFWSIYHDSFINVINTRRWNEIVNFDEHDDLAVVDEISLDYSDVDDLYWRLSTYYKSHFQAHHILEGCWVGMLKNRSSMKYTWVHGKYPCVCDTINDLWISRKKSGFHSLSKKRRLPYVDWNRIGCVGISISPDFAKLSNEFSNWVNFNLDTHTPRQYRDITS